MSVKNSVLIINPKQDELSDLLSWFNRYDVQCMQYQRAMRVHGTSDMDIASLDEQAIINAQRIKDLRVEIFTLEDSD